MAKKKVDIKETVYGYKTKYDKGFTSAEIKDLLTKFSKLKEEKFCEALGVHGAACINGETVTYHHDIAHALEVVLEGKRNRHETESLMWNNLTNLNIELHAKKN